MLQIANGASLSIAPLGALTMVGDVLNDGQMTIQSSSSGDGSFIDGRACLGSGTFTVERYLAQRDGIMFLRLSVMDYPVFLPVYI